MGKAAHSLMSGRKGLGALKWRDEVDGHMKERKPLQHPELRTVPKQAISNIKP